LIIVAAWVFGATFLCIIVWIAVMAIRRRKRRPMDPEEESMPIMIPPDGHPFTTVIEGVEIKQKLASGKLLLWKILGIYLGFFFSLCLGNSCEVFLGIWRGTKVALKSIDVVDKDRLSRELETLA
jgi:hypothetical protein